MGSKAIFRAELPLVSEDGGTGGNLDTPSMAAAFDSKDWMDTSHNDVTTTMFNLYRENIPIASARGVEYFTSLNSLDLYRNKLSRIDLSGNAALDYMRLSDNRLVGHMDLRANTVLRNADLDWNKITIVDLPPGDKLKIFSNCREQTPDH